MFVQSTSYNRVLMPDTEFLYDTGEGEVVSSEVEAAKPAAAISADDAKEKPSTGRGVGRGKRKKAEEVSIFITAFSLNIKLLKFSLSY